MSSPDRKTRVKGNRVIHTTRGGTYHGDAAERPRGLTTEQAEDQRRGVKIDERQRREAGERIIDAKPRRVRGNASDESAAAPFGKKGSPRR